MFFFKLKNGPQLGSWFEQMLQFFLTGVRPLKVVKYSITFDRVWTALQHFQLHMQAIHGYCEAISYLGLLQMHCFALKCLCILYGQT